MKKTFFVIDKNDDDCPVATFYATNSKEARKFVKREYGANFGVEEVNEDEVEGHGTYFHSLPVVK